MIALTPGPNFPESRSLSREFRIGSRKDSVFPDPVPLQSQDFGQGMPKIELPELDVRKDRFA